MADRYWVGASGAQWTTTNTAVWSASSNGPSGASVPTAADSVFFDQAGTRVVVLIGAITCLDFNVTAGTLTFTNLGTLTISGNMSISNVTPTWDVSGVLTFNATSAKTITTNGMSLISCPVTFNGVGGSWALTANLITGDTTLTNGTLTLGSYTLTCNFFSSSNSNARTIDFGTGKIVVTAAVTTLWTTATSTNLTIAGTPVVDISRVGNPAISSAISAGSIPEASAISFNITSGTYTLTITGNINNLNFNGFSGSLVASVRTIFGNTLFSSTMTINAGTSGTIFGATSGPKTITTNGKTLDFPLSFNGVGGSWTLQDALTMGATRALTLTNGTLNANNLNVTIGTFALGSGTKTLTLGSGVWTVLGTSWNASTNVNNFTVSASTGTISMTSASAKTFSGGAKTWPTLNQGGAGALTVAQDNTFANITNTVQPATIRLTAGTTQTVSAFTVSGTSGNLITLDTTVAGTRATLSDNGGTNTVSFVSIKDISATGGATWNALLSDGNVDAGNNLGWVFTAAGSSGLYSGTSGLALGTGLYRNTTGLWGGFSGLKD